MTHGDDRFPWDSIRATGFSRSVVALVFAIAAGAIILREYLVAPGHHSDFGQLWFGARAFAGGVNPWPLIGPGLAFDWSWPLFYPATALVASLPVAVFSEAVAATLFVAISVFILVYGLTREGWHRVPGLLSLPFMVAASAGQWSALMTSGWFLPWTAAFWICKPTLGAALAISTPSKRSLFAAAVGALALTAISLIMMPSWPGFWMSELSAITHMKAPILHWGGFIVVACVLRLRRPEAWLVLALACVPQSPAVYDLLLILLIVPSTFREALVLSTVCTLGLALMNLVPEGTQALEMSVRGAIIVASCYLPATVMVLRRPNAGVGPAWIRLIARNTSRA